MCVNLREVGSNVRERMGLVDSEVSASRKRAKSVLVCSLCRLPTQGMAQITGVSSHLQSSELKVVLLLLMV